MSADYINPDDVGAYTLDSSALPPTSRHHVGPPAVVVLHEGRPVEFFRDIESARAWCRRVARVRWAEGREALPLMIARAVGVFAVLVALSLPAIYTAGADSVLTAPSSILGVRG
jgi:hypothetical protein